MTSRVDPLALWASVVGHLHAWTRPLVNRYAILSILAVPYIALAELTLELVEFGDPLSRILSRSIIITVFLVIMLWSWRALDDRQMQARKFVAQLRDNAQDLVSKAQRLHSNSAEAKLADDLSLKLDGVVDLAVKFRQGGNTSVSVRLFRSSRDPRCTEPVIELFACDTPRKPRRLTSKEVRFDQNEAFRQIVKDGAPYFAAENLQAEAYEGRYRNEEPWRGHYNAVLVVPIGDEHRLLGFLCLESSGGASSQRLRKVAVAVAKELYKILIPFRAHQAVRIQDRAPVFLYPESQRTGDSAAVSSHDRAGNGLTVARDERLRTSGGAMRAYPLKSSTRDAATPFSAAGAGEHLSPFLIHAYAMNQEELSAEKVKAIEAHNAECERCRMATQTYFDRADLYRMQDQAHD